MGARALIPGYEILWYEIESVLGQGGFGITYLAHDKNLDRKVAIKEYLPTSFAYRHQDYSVKPITSDHGDNYAWGLSSFLTEAQTLARFSHKNIVRVQSVFEQNNTAYMVMDYEEGASLSSIFSRHDQLDQAFFEDVFFPIFDGLKEIHELGFIHRDIKPANIYIRENNTPVLIDFGSARQTSQQQTGEMTSLVSQGYTPLEQYSPNYGEQGPWTDIYALAATLYQGVSGKKPAEALSRSACLLRAQPDIVEILNHSDFPLFSDVFLSATHKGLALQPEERPEDLYAWGSLFNKDHFSTSESVDSNYSDTYTHDATRLMPSSTGMSSSYDDSQSTTTQSSSTVVDNAWAQNMPSHNENGNTLEGFDLMPNSSTSSSEAVDLNFESDDDMQRPATRVFDNGKQVKNKKRSNLAPAVAGGLLLLGVAVLSYTFLMGYFSSSTLIIAELPKPASPITTTLPEQHALQRLVELDRLALYYAQAHKLDQDNEQINTGIQSVFREVESVAVAWNPTRFGEIKDSVGRVISRLPDLGNNKATINARLSGQGSFSGSDVVLSLIDNNQILSPEGDSVIDVIPTLDKSDYDLLTKSPEWQAMMKRMVNSAAAHMKNAEFDSGARVVEAALAIYPEDTTMLKLREHLALKSVQ